MKKHLLQTYGFILIVQFSGFAFGSGECPVAQENRLEVQEMNYENLFSFLNNHKDNINSVGLLLSCLPPEIFKYYTLVYESNSLQSASFQSPRVIVYSNHSKFIFTFNGDGEKIEIIQYADNSSVEGKPKARFDFYEIDFSPSDQINATHPKSPPPKKCLSCHQSHLRTGVDPRPNWEAYNIWKGVYGSFDNFLGLYGQKKRYEYATIEQEKVLLSQFSKNPQDHYQVRSGYSIYGQNKNESKIKNFLSVVKERKELLKFIEGASHHERYRLLGNVYDNYIIKDQSTQSQTNLLLTLQLYILNYSRMERLLSQHELWHSYLKYKVISELWGCSNNVDQKLQEGLLGPIVIDSYLENTESRLNILFSTYYETGEDLSMSFLRSGRSTFADPTSTHSNFSALIISKDAELNAKLGRSIASIVSNYGTTYYRFISGEQKSKVCATTEPKINDFESNNPVEKQTLRKRNKKLAVLECVRCHHEKAPSDAPKIPFEDEEKMRELLLSGSMSLSKIKSHLAPNSRNPMPPDAPLTLYLKSEFEKYLDSLIK